MGIEELLLSLQSKDNNLAYQNLKLLEEISEKQNNVYPFIDTMLEMLENANSYIRVRGFRLICINAKWDTENRINVFIDKILTELEAEKATAVRQCLAAIKDMIEYKKELREKIKEKLLGINYLNYKDTMQQLIFKDVGEVLQLIDTLAKEEK